MDRGSRTQGSAGAVPLSMEASLDEENKAVLAGLERQRSHSPVTKQSSDRSPPIYRSMLDVDPAQPRHGSIAGIGVGVTSPRDQRKPSKRLNPADPSTWTSSVKPPSPTATRTPAAATETVGASQGLPKIQVESKQDFEQKYNFDMASMPSTGGGPKAVQDKRPREGSSSLSKGESSGRRGSKETNTMSVTHRTGSPRVGALSPDSTPSKQRTSSSSVSDDAKRRLSNKSNSFSSAVTEGSDDLPSRVMADGGDEDALAESSSEEDKRASSSDEDSPETERGRSREKDEEEPSDDIRETQVERPSAPQSQGVRSLIEPLMSPSIPRENSGEVHPPSSFGRSGPTAADFQDEDDIESDIQKAKNMGMVISPADDSVQDRLVRMIIRGQWAKFQDEEENNSNLSPRLYLLCTDLSTEAQYAMEWTVGTMLRDGDTLLAIYAIEDENAPKEPENHPSVITESAKAAQDASDALETLTRQTTNLENNPMTKFVPAIEAPKLAESLKLSQMTKKEAERIKALDEISNNFHKLVRKTPLQVRCMIEVIHCKSPKHLILNAIDELEPTLCVVGTRGRSSLKGVLLGSFSNYLVTKSSVPVMVARRRLKKPHHAKVNSSSIRLANNLTNSALPRQRRSLTQARID